MFYCAFFKMRNYICVAFNLTKWKIIFVLILIYSDVIVLKDGQFQAKLRFGEIKIVPLPEDVYPGSRFYFDPNESWTHFALQLVSTLIILTLSLCVLMDV